MHCHSGRKKISLGGTCFGLGDAMSGTFDGCVECCVKREKRSENEAGVCNQPSGIEKKNDRL